jgi:acetyl esterase/lipase
MLRVFFFFVFATVLFNVNGANNPRSGRLKRMIDRFDRNKDGKVSRDEYPWRKTVFDKLDTNKDGDLTLEEFSKIQSMRRRTRTDAKLIPDIPYATVDGKKQLLDIYMPKKSTGKPILVVWVHGGGWTKGSKNDVHRAFLALTQNGFAVASIDYRLEGIKAHPKLIHDCKGAIRFLRAKAKKYGYNADKIGVGGGSAGGHLALLLGTSGGDKKLEGTVGGNLDQSSSVQAVVDLFGPSELVSQPRIKQKMGSEYLREVAISASPVTYIDKHDPPLLIYHGTDDRVVPIEQSRIIHKKYQAAGLTSKLNVIEGAGHGFKPSEFDHKKESEVIKKFFDRHLK